MDPNIIPIVAIITSFTFTLGVVGFSLYFGYQKRQLLSKEILSAIEKGMDIPIQTTKKRNYRNLGIIYTFLGAILAVALWASTGTLVGLLWGMVPMVLGLAFLVISKKKEED